MFNLPTVCSATHIMYSFSFICTLVHLTVVDTSIFIRNLSDLEVIFNLPTHIIFSFSFICTLVHLTVVRHFLLYHPSSYLICLQFVMLRTLFILLALFVH